MRPPPLPASTHDHPDSDPWRHWLLDHYDPAESLLAVETSGASGHSALPAGVRVHPIRESATAAVHLLASGDPAHRPVAIALLTRVVDLQETCPTSPFHGIWGYYLEEPAAAMARADWNWADFLGAALIDAIHHHAARLPPELVARCEHAIRLAAFSIYRRNINAHYTNIAAMSAAVALWHGERADDPVFLRFGAEKIHALRTKTDYDGGFAEYNSPTYTTVLALQFERILRTVRHAGARADARHLLDLCWRLTAEQFHPGTGQWAGAQSRSYARWLEEFPARYIEQRTGLRIARRPDPANPHYDIPAADLPDRPSCPPELVARFATLPAPPHQTRQVWNHFPDGRPGTVTTFWADEDATLGSVSIENTWNNRRVIQGYWRTETEPAARLLVRFLKDGREFVSGCIRATQDGPRLLAALHCLTGAGETHPHWDVPADGAFTLADLRVRIEVEGRGAAIRLDSEGRFLLSVGDRQAIVTPGPLLFDGAPGPGWSRGGAGDLVFVEGVLYDGPTRRFHPGETGEILAAFALALLPCSAEPPSGLVSLVREGDDFIVETPGLPALRSPRRSPPSALSLP